MVALDLIPRMLDNHMRCHTITFFVVMLVVCVVIYSFFELYGYSLYLELSIRPLHFKILFETAIILSRILGKEGHAKENAVYLVIRNSCMMMHLIV